MFETFENLLRDLRLALRIFAKRPLITGAAALCLAVGIGATVAVFSLVNAVLLEPLRYAEPDELHFLWAEMGGQEVDQAALLPREYIALTEGDHAETLDRVLDGTGAVVAWFYNLTGGDLPERLLAERVTAGYFDLLGSAPRLGRGIEARDAEAGRAVTVISDRLWRQRFAEDEAILGTTIVLDGTEHEIVGVAGPDFDPILLADADLWVPLDPRGATLPPEQRRVTTVVRLADGVGPERAAAVVGSFQRGLEEMRPDDYPADAGFALRLESVKDETVGEARPLLWILLGAVALIMLLACANVANLLLAQATSRDKEIAIRTSIGADGWRIVRQLLSESVLLGLIGGTLGVLLAQAGVNVLRSLDLGNIPRLGEVRIDAAVLGFALLVSVVTGVLFGLAPALQALRTDLQSTLKEGGKTSASGGKHPLRTLLVMAEVAVAVVVLCGAGLMLRTFQKLESVDPGFRTDGVLTMQLFLSLERYQTPEDRAGYAERLLTELAAVPEVARAGIVSHLPLGPMDYRRDITVEGWTPSPGESATPVVGWRFVTPDALDAMGVELVAGRGFTAGDDLHGAPVVIVDEAMAERFWPDRDPIGQRLHLNTPRPPFNSWRTVVGVARQVRHQGLQVADDQQLYVPYAQFPYPVVALALESRTDDPLAVARGAREAAFRVDPLQPLANVQTFDELVAASVSRPRFNRLLFTVFGLVAIILVAVGVYGVMSYTAAQQAREMGLRLALGARRRTVFALVLGQGMKVAAAGLVVGLVASYALTRTFQSQIADLVWGVSTFDPATVTAVVTLMLVLALGANLLPAFRATRVDPLVVLREE